MTQNIYRHTATSDPGSRLLEKLFFIAEQKAEPSATLVILIAQSMAGQSTT